jgi:hypothetical protein
LIKKAEIKEMVHDAVEGYGKAIRNMTISNFSHVLSEHMPKRFDKDLRTSDMRYLTTFSTCRDKAPNDLQFAIA